MAVAPGPMIASSIIVVAKVLLDFAHRQLNYTPRGSDFMPEWCMTMRGDDTALTKAAIVAYVAYRATNIARRALAFAVVC